MSKLSVNNSLTGRSLNRMDLRQRLNEPVAAAFLAFFRIAFGFVMVWETLRYFNHDWIRRHWIDPVFQLTGPSRSDEMANRVLLESATTWKLLSVGPSAKKTVASPMCLKLPQ